MKTMTTTARAPSVNGVPLAGADERLDGDTLRQRAHLELLRQAAIDAGLLAADDPAPTQGATSAAASAAIESLLDAELAALPQPDDASCRRFHAGNAARWAVGERALVRHVLFAVTAGTDVNALRQRAEAALIDLRARTRSETEDRFAAAASQLSNCPSGADGGALGWLAAEDCAPEFGRELFGHSEVGVLPRLVHSRFGLHVVEVLQREGGSVPPYEAVRAQVLQALSKRAYATALRQLLQRLAGDARIEGVPELAAADSPLLQ
jgi:peptidyl-prolyl cis-trans isomerase C